MTAVFAPSRSLRILSVEDEARTIEGPLDSLADEGHSIEQFAYSDEAAERLAEEAFDLLVLDQRLIRPDGTIDYEGGTRLVMELKRGDYGTTNIDVPFVFVTGSEAWIRLRDVERLRGYKGVLLKGGPLTPQLLQVCESVRPDEAAPIEVDIPEELDRVLVRVETTTGSELRVVVPSWDPHVEVSVPIDALPDDLAVASSRLPGRHLFAWMDLEAPTSEAIELTNFELAEEPDEDDGLA